jgi:multidrug resistance efflux pump
LGDYSVDSSEKEATGLDALNEFEQSERVGNTLAVPTRRTKKKLTRFTRIGLGVVVIVSLLETLAFSGSYYFYSRHYVSTDNAQVDGDKMMINAPASGILIDWTANQGVATHKNQVVGRIEIQDGFAKPQMPIRAPADGTVALDNGLPGTFVTTGAQLGVVYNLEKIYVTARIKDTDIGDVQIGAPVDIRVDSFPNTQVTGIVEEIQDGTAGRFTIYPAPDTDPTNPQKIQQYVPVKIELVATNGIILSPGMNATVHIHRA